MGIIQDRDVRAFAFAGQGTEVVELPRLRTVPWGYYLKRNGGIGRLQATELFQDYYKKSKGHEFLCMESEYSRETVEACIYLRELGTPEPTGEVGPTIPKKRKKRKLKKGGK